MKKILFALIIISLFATCKEKPEPFMPTCTNFTLEKVDSNAWKYCRLFNNEVPTKCNDKNDTLTLKILKHFDNIKAMILPDEPNTYCLYMDDVYEGIKDNGTKEKFRYLTVYNLPECFKKDKLKVLISGDLRPWPGLNELNCGEPFELTKIEEIP